MTDGTLLTFRRQNTCAGKQRRATNDHLELKKACAISSYLHSLAKAGHRLETRQAALIHKIRH